jgi:ABC-type polysaccharide/polyol phosphate export permease
LLNVGVGAALSVIINRYRDIQKILTSFVVVIMVTTPIFWQPGMITGVRKLVYLLNPFYYIVEAVRQPMLGQFDLKIFLILLTLSMSSLIVGTYFHVKYSKSVIFRL